LAKPLLFQAFLGFNTCLFAYGQTGTGKSYSMMGKIGRNSEISEASGIVPRFCQDLFSHVEVLERNSATTSVRLSCEIQISLFEIYKEQIQDLLCSSKGNLSVREHPTNVRAIICLLKLAYKINPIYFYFYAAGSLCGESYPVSGHFVWRSPALARCWKPKTSGSKHFAKQPQFPISCNLHYYAVAK